MNSLDILNRSRRLSYTDIDSYTNDTWIEDLNLVYQDMVDSIVAVSKWDYFWDTGKTDTVIWQSEYTADKLWVNPDALDIKKINKVFIKYTADQEYLTQVRYQNPWVLENHPDYYKENQPESDPFFYIQDNSIFVYPAATSIISNWLEMFVIHKPAKLDILSTEDDIELPSQFHKTLSDWLMQYIYMSQGKINEAMSAEQRYNQWVDEMVKVIKQRYNQPVKKTVSNLNQYR